MRKLAIIIGILMLCGIVIAQQTTTYTGYMGDTVPDDTYPVYLEAGQTIEILAEADNSALDPYIGLRGPGGDMLIENDDYGASLNSFIRYTATTTGTYTVIMSNISGTDGNYRLNITVYAQGEVGDTVVHTGYMGDDVPDNTYPVYLEAGQTVEISAEADNSALDPYLVLRGPEKGNVAENDDRDSSTLNAFIRYTAPTSGGYTVVVSNYPETSGNYRLTITVSTSSAPSAGGMETLPDGSIVYTGYMGDDVPDDRYPIQLENGQMVHIIAEADNSALDPYIALTGATGTRVAENDDRDNTTLNSYIQYIAKTAGTYMVIMSNISGTGGNYRLTIRFGEVGDMVESPPETTVDVREGDMVYTGYMGDDVSDGHYTVRMEAGQGLVASAEMTSGNLDPFLLLFAEGEREVARNDDKDSSTLNSELVFIAQESGEYTLVISNIRETSGDYRLTVAVRAGNEVAIPSRVAMSGPILNVDTEHFRIHYTLEGQDAVSLEYANAVAQTMEEVLQIQTALGWPMPPEDGVMGGDSRYDVYLMDLLTHSGEGDMGYNSPEWPAGDNPNTPAIEQYAVASYLVLDNNYTGADTPEGKASFTLMRATAAHEFHHGIQFGYDLGDRHSWYYEATAAWMETVTFPTQQDATGYVEGIFTYPEVCFGVEGDADPTGGLLMYGSWLFMDALATTYGDSFPIQLWENIAQYEGWEALEETLKAYNDTVPSALARYHLRNLARDYTMAPEFSDYTVWLENVIGTSGEWTFNGRGIQELAANYYEVTLPPGDYAISVQSRETPELELWALGISGSTAEAFPLGNNGILRTGNHDHLYLVVFNPQYDEDVTNCSYSDYTLSVSPGMGTMPGAAFKFSAANFAPPARQD